MNEFFRNKESIDDDSLQALRLFSLDNIVLQTFNNLSVKKAFMTYADYILLQYQDRSKLVEKAESIYTKVFKEEFKERFMESEIILIKLSSFIVSMKENKFTYKEIRETYNSYKSFSRKYSIDPYSSCTKALNVLKSFEDTELEEIFNLG